jgi:hypothetical protein
MNKGKIRDGIVRWKFRVSYFGGFLTTFAAILIITTTLQDKLTFIGIHINYLVMLPAMIIIFFIGAFLLDKLGFIDSEIEYSNSKNRILKEIHKKNE